MAEQNPTDEKQTVMNAVPVTWVDADFAVDADNGRPLVAITLMNSASEMQMLGMDIESSRNAVKDILAAMSKSGDDWADKIIERLASTI